MSSGFGDDQEFGFGAGLATAPSKTKLKPPSMYRVVLLNDDYTPMDFVIEILMIFFNMNEQQATDVMLTVHTKGKGICGVFSKDVAETKALMVNEFSKEHQHPLLCEVEVAD
jgi:ATP-dependent Clp protease adaptor protein ClpS